jgi:putative transposase
MSTVLRIGKHDKVESAGLAEAHTVHREELDTRIALIQALIPLGLQAVDDLLQQEVAALAGPRYAHGDGAPHVVRWGRQRGAVYLADQKVPLAVPRVRNRQAGTEVPLQTYARLRQPRDADEGMTWGRTGLARAAEALPDRAWPCASGARDDSGGGG